MTERTTPMDTDITGAPERFAPPTRFAVPGRIGRERADRVRVADGDPDGDPPRDPAGDDLPVRGARLAGHVPGQHLLLRLTAEDGYWPAPLLDRVGAGRLRAPRADAGPCRGRRGLGLVPHGGPHGDRVELRGPLSGFFAWRATGPRCWWAPAPVWSR
ncbi:hypothetical protein GCM10023238_09130 [Streptomyces heliomycini]